MSAISWLGPHGLTLNPGVYGCTPAGAACDHCYAARMARRLVTMETAYTTADTAGTTGHRIVDADGWTGTVLLDDLATARARIRAVPRCRTGRRRVFVTSMGDILHASIPTDWIVGCLDEMALRTDVDWMPLTKRADRWPEVARWMDVGGYPSWPANVWPGVTVWDQESADRLIPPLLQVPGGVRWVSVEPMLGPVDLVFSAFTGAESVSAMGGLGWVIAGGENGPGARPMHPDWVRSLRDQCQGARVPFHFKSWGEWVEVGPLSAPQQVVCGLCGWHGDFTDEALDEHYHATRHRGHYQLMYRVGRTGYSGRLLDGRTWEEVPHD